MKKMENTHELAWLDHIAQPNQHMKTRTSGTGPHGNTDLRINIEMISHKKNNPFQFSVLAAMVIAALLLFFSLAVAGEPTGLSAFYRQGQTFITWSEDSQTAGERYRIYRHDQPITQQNLAEAAHIATLFEGSADIRQPIEKLAPSLELPFRNHIIHDVDKGGTELPFGTGLLVWTCKEKRLAYYAVVMEVNGTVSSQPVPGISSLTTGVYEDVEMVGAVKVHVLEPAGFWYCHWMDYTEHNPRIVDDCHNGYAFLFHVVIPDDPLEWNDPLPLEVHFHGRGAYRGQCTRSTVSGKVMLFPKDFFASWFYGHSDALTWTEGPNQFSTSPATQGDVVNFFWRRVEHAVKWLKSKPDNLADGQVTIDKYNVISKGFSMGGTHGNTVAIRHGDIYSGVVADKGIVNWLKADTGPTNWLASTFRFWGEPATNLVNWDGQLLYEERMNIPKWLREHPEAEIPFMQIVYGRYDNSISFEAAPEYAEALQAGRHPFTFAWNTAGHIPTWGTGAKNSAETQPMNETLPAFSNSTAQTPLEDVPYYGSSVGIVKGYWSTLEPGVLHLNTGHPDYEPIDQDLSGKWLSINAYPYAPGCPPFRIAGNTQNSISIQEGDLTTAHFCDTRMDDDHKVFRVAHGRPDGIINVRLEWCSSVHDFDSSTSVDDIVDERNSYGMNVRTATSLGRKGMEHMPDDPDAKIYVDITPRRIQEFHLQQGQVINWSNMDYSDPLHPVEVASGSSTVDEYGLVTVERFEVGKQGLGNRLILSRAEELLEYGISVSVDGDEYGSVSPSGSDVVVYEGDTPTFSISPNHGYGVDVVIDSESVGSVFSYTFPPIDGNHDLDIRFFPLQVHTISMTVTAGSGSITPEEEGTVYHGMDRLYHITPDPGYGISDVLVDGVSVGPLARYKFFDISENHSVEAVFHLLAVHTITASTGDGGEISPSGIITPVYEGSFQSFEIIPDADSIVKDVIIDGNSIGPVTYYAFTNVTDDHTIHATFKPDPRTCLVDLGTVSEDNSYDVPGWESVTIDPYTSYTSLGPGGTTPGRTGNYDYVCINGSVMNFPEGRKIVVTWYNDGSSALTFTPKISFDDPNRSPAGYEPVGTWYEMTELTLGGRQTGITEFEIPANVAGDYELVNISCNVSNVQNKLVLDKIEYEDMQGTVDFDSDLDTDGMDLAAFIVELQGGRVDQDDLKRLAEAFGQ